MPEITAKMVNELRAKTGLGMMECKKALVENAGDVQKTEDWFRKKGVKTSINARHQSFLDGMKKLEQRCADGCK